MRVYIYDLEVFSHDWVAVFQQVEDGVSHESLVIHNSNYHLKDFINQKDLILGGFNNKHYDDWILQTMLNGAEPFKVKEHNDFIIGGGNGWEFPFIQWQRRYFKSFDLRDDLPLNVSLKSIEGNMGAPIVESSVRFDIDRPLTEKELAEVIEYCKTDVANTVKLFKTRKKYLESKRQVARLKGMDEVEALSLTNAKLTARFLDAKKIPHDDELVYEAPAELRIGRYAQALEFFMNPVDYTLRELEAQLAEEKRKIKVKSLTRKIEKLKSSNNRYECKLTMDIAGVPHILGWGGLHGAVNKLFYRNDPDYRIVTIDVGSYYPSMMLQYNYISRNIPSAAGYAEVYHTRLNAKHSGDKATADALKLILNTCYGAMKNPYNELYDPRNASAICITGMLLLTDLIDKLENVPGFQLIQSNTDGIIIRYPVKVEDQIESTVSEWESRTRLNMEYTVIHAIAQKDVNNYVMKAGETYMIKDDKKIVTEPDKGKLKTKGGYVSLAEGGNFINNSMVVVHRALVNFFMDGVPIEKTISECDTLPDFQIIAKTGSSYDGTYWEVEGERVEVQRVNRVYASRDPKYGTIYKRKNGKDSTVDITNRDEETGRSDKIASLPDHCIIDNENELNIADIDKQFYIDLAKKRVEDYLGKTAVEGLNTKKENRKMSDKKVKNVWEKLIEARLKFQQADVKKTGINRFAEFKYFELADIVPPATRIFNDLGLVFVTTFEGGNATGTLINTEAPEELIQFVSPMRELTVVSATGKNKMNELQGLGAEETYQRRYLYMMCLDIVEADVFDATSGEDSKSIPTKKASCAAPKQREEAKKDLIDADGNATEVQIKSIKNGLKKLREKSDDHEEYIKDCVKKVKKDLSKKEAEALLIEIGEKVAA